jgi:hypothetical protein
MRAATFQRGLTGCERFPPTKAAPFFSDMQYLASGVSTIHWSLGIAKPSGRDWPIAEWQLRIS